MSRASADEGEPTADEAAAEHKPDRSRTIDAPATDRRATLGRRAFVGAVAGAVAAVGLATPASATDAGEELWQREIEGGFFQTAATVYDGTVYAGSDRDGGELVALDADTGEVEWRFTDPDSQVRTAPNVVDDVAVFAEEAGPVYALDLDDQEPLWTAEPDTYDFHSAPTVHDGRVFLGAEEGRGTLYALDATTGDVGNTERLREDDEPLWEFTEHGGTGNGFGQAPTVEDATVYANARNGQLYAVEGATGETEWERDLPANGDTYVSPTVADGYVVTANHGGLVLAYDAASGDVEWEYQVEQEDFATVTSQIRSSPTVYDGTVYVGSYAGIVYAIDLEDGGEEWTHDVGEEVRSAPTVAGGRVFVGSSGEGLWAFDADDGDVVWHEADLTVVDEAPTVVDGVLYVPASGEDGWRMRAYETGVDASSEDSRVLLGTLGHHDGWAGAGQTIGETDAGSDDGAGTDDPGGDATDDDSEAGDSDDVDGDDGAADDDDDGLPGFGVGGAITAVGSATYLLKRRLTADQTQSE